MSQSRTQRGGSGRQCLQGEALVSLLSGESVEWVEGHVSLLGEQWADGELESCSGISSIFSCFPWVTGAPSELPESCSRPSWEVALT